MGRLVGAGVGVDAGGTAGRDRPVRGAAGGFSSLGLGRLGSGWAVGYVAGCLVVRRLVREVGHIRAFSAMGGLAAISILVQLLAIHPFAWIPLRAVTGFCFAGAAMIVESWLTERTEAGRRGRVFGIYTMVNLAASTTGQLLLVVGDTAGFQFFVIGAIFYAMALLPTAMTRQLAPRPMRNSSLDIRALWRNSPLAVAGVALVGISNSAFGTLGAVYGARIGMDVTTIALFMSAALISGAVFQVPLGLVSDRLDRRFVLLGLGVLALVVDLAFIVLAPQNALGLLLLIGAFGAAIFGMYPVIVAHANDHAPPGDFIRTSSGLLLIFGLGSIIGPLIAGVVMNIMGPAGLFLTSLGAHVLIIAFALLRIIRRDAPAGSEKSSFTASPLAGVSTPQTAVLRNEGSASPEDPAPRDGS